MSAQVVVHGYSNDDAQPMITLVDSASLRQVDCILEWDDAKELARRLTAAANVPSGSTP